VTTNFESGLLAYQLALDPRVTALGIFNSGALAPAQRVDVPKFTKPIAYFMGGKSDIAWANVSFFHRLWNETNSY
jgi:hypothetical protein